MILSSLDIYQRLDLYPGILWQITDQMDHLRVSPKPQMPLQK